MTIDGMYFSIKRKNAGGFRLLKSRNGKARKRKIVMQQRTQAKSAAGNESFMLSLLAAFWYSAIRALK